MVVALPDDLEKYLAGLGRTRQNLRRYFRRFATSFPTYTFSTLRSSEIDHAFVHRMVEMNRQRMASKGWVSSYRDEDEAFLLERAQRHGFACAITIDGTIVAGTLSSRVGDQVYLHITTFSNEYFEYHLGYVVLFLLVSACIDAGVEKLHFLWGKSEYKMRFGCIEERVHDGFVYRSWIWWALSMDDIAKRTRWRWRTGRASAMRAALRRRLRRLYPLKQ